jgi:hypothetical protein
VVPIFVREYRKVPDRRAGEFQAKDRDGMIERFGVWGHGEQDRATYVASALEVHGEALGGAEQGNVIACVAEKGCLEHREKFRADSPYAAMGLGHARPAARALVLPEHVTARTDEGPDLVGDPIRQSFVERGRVKELFGASEIVELYPEPSRVKLVN